MPAPNGMSTRSTRWYGYRLAALGMTGAAMLAVVGVGVGFVMLRAHPNGKSATALRRAVTQIAEAKQERTTATRALDGARARARVVEREAATAVSRAEAARARARVIGLDDVQVSAAPNAAVALIRVPPPVVERMRLDSSAVSTLGMLVRWKDTVIVMQDRRITADSLELLATTNAFAALERAREPRCGRRCGIILGVGGMLATAVAMEQVRRMFR